MARRVRRRAQTMDVVNPRPKRSSPIRRLGADTTDVDAAVEAARAALNGPWGKMSARERGRLVGKLARPADGEGGRGRAARDAAQRQADLRVAAHRDPGRGGVLRVLRRLGRQGDGGDDPGQGQLPHLHAARAARRRRRDRAVELPAAAGGLEGRAGARVRQHRHPEAGEPDAADRARARRDRRRGRAAARRAERDHRAGLEGRPGDRRAPGIDKIAFTGDTRTGKGIMRSAADTLKKITLELGGKSPNIVLPDADIDAALRGATIGIFYGKGEVCAAGSRLLVDKSIKNEFMDKLAARAKKMVAGDPHGSQDALRRAVVEEAARDRAALHRVGQEGRARRSSPAASAPTSAPARATSSSRRCSPT